DGSTAAYGSISARGGANGGNGGLVETSGHDLVIDGVSINAGAAKGKAGTWLLDPYDIEVVSTGTASPADVATFTGGLAAGVTKIAPSVLVGSGTDIILQAQHDLTFTDALAAVRSVRGQAGNNIFVNNSVTSSGGTIDLRAGSQLNLGASALLASSKAVDLKADQMVLAGNIRGMGSLPLVSFTTSTDSRPIAVRAGTAEPTELSLDAAALNTRVQASEINIGNSNHTGSIGINAAITTGSNLVLDNAGSINVNAPVTANSFAANLFGTTSALVNVSATGSVSATRSVLLQANAMQLAGSVSAPAVRLMPHDAGAPFALGGSGLGQASLEKIATSDLTIGGQIGQYAPLQVTGALDFTRMAQVPTTVTLDGGDAPIELGGALKTSNTLVLKSSMGMYQSSDAGITADKLLATGGGSVDLTGANSIGTVAGTTSTGLFHVNTTGNVRVGQVGSVSGISTGDGWVYLSSQGAVSVDSVIETGESAVTIRAAGINGSGTIKASAVDLTSTAGIGTAAAPLNTQAHLLLASNQQAGGNPINVRNTGELLVARAIQSDAATGANTGGIRIESTDRMSVLSLSPTHGETLSASASA
ncbi:MAG TPA: hypothetical protein VNT33_12550, partial [Telluria sp.]|nr:hypothetical protein [Telluria sp.]